MKKLDNPQIAKGVADHLALGVPQKDIAQQIGVSQMSISRFSRREDIREYIKARQLDLIEVVPDAIENVKTLVREMKGIPVGEVRRRELSYTASKDVLKSVGLYPTPVQSQVMINIMNREGLPILSPRVMALLEQIEPKFDIIDFEEKG